MSLQAAEDDVAGIMDQLAAAVKNVTDAATIPEKKKLEAAAKPLIKEAKSQLNAFRAEIRKSTNPTQKTVFERKHKEYEGKVKDAEKELRNQIYPQSAKAEKKSYSEQRRIDMMGEGGEDGSGFTSATQVLDAGRRINEDALESIKRSQRLVSTAEDTGNETLQTLQKQTEQLYKIDEELANLQGQLDRASRDVQWFARQMAGDKCFLTLIGVVILALVGLVFYSAYKKKQSSTPAPAAPTPVPPQYREYEVLGMQLRYVYHRLRGTE
jgi:hypothetical protein